MSDSIELGKEYKDSITGFKGVATAQCHYLSGCDHIMLEALVQGTVKELWFDIPRLKLIHRKKKGKGKKSALTWGQLHPGGPASTPPNRSTPPQASAEAS